MYQVWYDPGDVACLFSTDPEWFLDEIEIASNNAGGVKICCKENSHGMLEISVSEDMEVFWTSCYSDPNEIEKTLQILYSEYIYCDSDDDADEFDELITNREEELEQAVQDFLEGISNTDYSGVMCEAIVNEVLKAVADLGYEVYRPVWVKDGEEVVLEEYPYEKRL